jgi:hypothetical protein
MGLEPSERRGETPRLYSPVVSAGPAHNLPHRLRLRIGAQHFEPPRLLS